MIKATYHHKKQVVDLLCESFDKNKSVNYVIKQDKRRIQRIKILMEYSFEMCYWFGNIYLSDDKSACALVMFPDKKRTSLKTIAWDIKLAAACIGLNRVSKIQLRDRKIKNNYPQLPIYYLWFLGVSPHQQQKGIGSTLLKCIINESEVIQRPIYLETSMPENIRFYNKHGFNVYKELHFGYTLFLIRKELN